ncbi:MAG TPA: glycosyltransferase [Ktedonobacteraceae bacterium]|nr:glycosyltransferase [Ktedonobacteraceae bacterium]
MKKQHRPGPRLLLWSHGIGVAGFYFALWLRTRPPKEDRIQRLLPGDQGLFRPENHPLISIILPARDEERNIRRCVESLLAQDYDNFEVIVVDDGSTDATPQILDELMATHPRRNRLYVLRLRDELPEGWAGKPHAIHKGVQEAHGSWLLFTDADTWHAPAALRTALAQAISQQLDLLSYGTRQELPGFWDKVMMPMAYIGIIMQYPPRKVNDPRSSIALANGQFILIRRSVYSTLGGYARPDLRNTLLDDRDLAHVVKWSGFRLRMLDGRNLVYVRMYRGLRDTWRGWLKNAFLGSRGGNAFTLLQLIGLPMISIVPFLLPLLLWIKKLAGKPQSEANEDAHPVRSVGTAPGAYPHTPTGTGARRCPYEVEITATELGAVTLLELLPLLAYKNWVDRELRVPWYYALTFPLAGAIFEGILAQSAWRVLTGRGVDWRGRRYFNTKD